LEVRVSGRAARRLYEKLGFVESGRRRNYYTGPAEDAIVMSLGLPGAVEKNISTGKPIGGRV